MPDISLDISASPTIDRYLDYRRFVRDWMSARRVGQRAVSFGWVARRAGCTPGHVKNVLDGRRRLQGDLLDGFARAMRLDDGDHAYFRALVEFNEAQAPTEVAAALTQLTDMQAQRGVATPESTGLRYLSRWHYAAIRELAFCRGFRDDPEWISQALRGRVSTEEARQALQTLVEIGLLVRRDDGPLRPASDGPIIRPSLYERPVLASRQRMEVMRQAQQALQDPASGAHDCRSVLIAIPASQVPALRDITRRFVRTIATLMDSSSAGLAASRDPNGRLVQTSINLLPLTHPIVHPRAR